MLWTIAVVLLVLWLWEWSARTLSAGSSTSCWFWQLSPCWSGLFKVETQSRGTAESDTVSTAGTITDAFANSQQTLLAS